MSRGRDLMIVAAASLALSLPFLGKAYHIDEPFFLAAARQIRDSPSRPYDFQFNWYGRAVPYREINNTPPALAAMLAGAWGMTGGGEVPMRLLLLPLDIAAAAALYLLAARFLREPLLPTLAVLAGPGYAINMGHLMAEKPAMAFGLWGLYAWTRWLDDGGRRWFGASAALMALAMLSKYSALALLAAAVVMGAGRGATVARLAAYAGASLSGAAAFALWTGAGNSAAWAVTTQGLGLPTAAWSHKLRSLLAFSGGGPVVAAFWPWAVPGLRRGWVAAVAVLAALLYGPWFDIGPVRPVDRILGMILGAGGALGLGLAWEGGSSRPGGLLWRPWIVAGLALAAAYWSVTSRVVLLATIPLVLALAERLEAGPAPRRRRWLWAGAALAGTLTVSLQAVDMRHAGGQKEAALRGAAAARAAGRGFWCAGHWGLQEYVDRRGGRMLDVSRGGWGEPRPGDIVVVPWANANVLRPAGGIRARVTSVTVDSAIPLRLTSVFGGEGGFYSNVFGFLPFSLSREPVDRLDFVEIPPDADSSPDGVRRVGPSGPSRGEHGARPAANP